MSEVNLDWSVCSCPFTHAARAQKAIATAWATSKVMISWDVVSNVPEGRAPSGKQLWQQMWEDKLQQTHQYTNKKGLKAIGIAIFGGGEGCQYERATLQTSFSNFASVIVPMNIVAFENACAGGQIVLTMDSMAFSMWVRAMHEMDDVWVDKY